MLHFVEIIRVG